MCATISQVEDIIANVLLTHRKVSKQDDPAIEVKSRPEVEAAIIKVAEARRMNSSGIADMLASYSDDDAS